MSENPTFNNDMMPLSLYASASSGLGESARKGTRNVGVSVGNVRILRSPLSRLFLAFALMSSILI